MGSRTRLFPYVMLGLLTLSVGLGVGLGLSQAPVTRPAGPTRGEVINVSGTCAKQAFPLKCELREARRNRVGLSTRVPQLVGLSFPHAISALSNAGLIYGVTYVESSEPAGTVVSQSYLPGTRLLQGVLVSLEVVSGVGSGSVMVPDVIGTAPPQAQIALNLADLAVTIDETTSTTAPASLIVVSEAPVPGSSVAPGSTVTIDVAPPD